MYYDFLVKIPENTGKISKNKRGATTGNDKTYSPSYTIPIFIELNRCTTILESNNNNNCSCSNFIIGYIKNLIQANNATFEYESEKEIIKKIWKEFHIIPHNGMPEYLLLLDGFNEVSTDMFDNSESIRAALSREIETLYECPNVRVITASRVTQSAYFTSKFTKINLLGLEDQDIIDYLKGKKIPYKIGTIMSNKALVSCLRTPLFLRIFVSSENNGAFIPETSGEILYHFFHKNSAYYNLRKRIEETCKNPLKNITENSEIIIDFILPYIGWYYEKNAIFSISEKAFIKQIQRGIDILHALVSLCNPFDFSKYNYDSKKLLKIIVKIQSHIQTIDGISQILSYINDYLGIIYVSEILTHDSEKRTQYGFIHHHFRDYFSAIWDIQLLCMLPHVDAENFININNPRIYSFNFYLNQHYWHDQKATYISHILLEHHNKPTLNKQNKNWSIPSYKSEEQIILSKTLDFCRKLIDLNYSAQYILQNTLTALKLGRGELSGINLKFLDFRQCSLFNTTCSKKGSTHFLAASFAGSRFSDKTFEPIDHLLDVKEYIYDGNTCYTIDENDTIKIWDVISGKQINCLENSFDYTSSDLSPNGFFKVSYNGNWLVLKGNRSTNIGKSATLIIYNLSKSKKTSRIISLPEKYRHISDFCFSLDSTHIYLLCDQHDLYCYSLGDLNMEYYKHLEDLSECSKIFSSYDCHSIYVFTSTYDFSNDIYDLDDSDDFVDLDDLGSDSDDFVECNIFSYNSNSDTVIKLHTFTSCCNTMPVFEYFPYQDCFLYYQNETQQLEFFECLTGYVTSVFSDILLENDTIEMPSALHCISSTSNHGYIMYPHTCYHIELNCNTPSSVIMNYEPPKLSSNQSSYYSESLEFVVHTPPSGNHILLKTNRHTYEWNTDTELLQLKYNTATYSACALIPDTSNNRFILVHNCNGISIFSSQTNQLINAYTFNDQDYDTTSAVYDPYSENLALLFEHDSHNFIKVLNLKNSSSEIIFSTIDPTQNINDICFSYDGLYLLISTNNACIEYCLSTQILHQVVRTNENEIITSSNYSPTNAIHVGIAQKFANHKIQIEARCEIYLRIIKGQKTSYQFDMGYFMPELTPELSHLFVHQNHDLGSFCSLKSNNLQSYWVTQGFFKDDTQNVHDFLKLRTFTKTDGVISFLEFKQFSLFSMIQVKHTMSIESSYHMHTSGNSYSYLSNNFEQAIFIQDYQTVIYWKNLKSNPASYQTFDYKVQNDSNYPENTYWDFAIPINNNQLICCSEHYRIFTVNATNGQFEREIIYTPGLAVFNCNFKDIQSDDSTLQLLKANGGVM